MPTPPSPRLPRSHPAPNTRHRVGPRRRLAGPRLGQGGDVDLGQVDVLDGTAVFTVTAPQELGDQSVTITGAQTAVELSADVAVVTNQSPVPTSSASPAAASAGTGSAPSNGALAITGATAPWALAGIAATMLAIGAYAVYRRRRGIA